MACTHSITLTIMTHAVNKGVKKTKEGLGFLKEQITYRY